MEDTKQHPATNLPNYGLSVPLDRLVEARAYVHKLPLEQQALFADGVCKQNATNEEFCKQQMPVEGKEKFHVWNTTAVGNCAYIAVHGPTQEIRDGYRQAVERYSAWREDQEAQSQFCVVV